jgi:CDP-glycerol glycerophosphotransferase (TagB/SpsB family)
MADDFPADIDRFNLIIKPHFFSFTKSRYRAQREKCDCWQQYPNVYFAPKDRVIPVPYLAVADLLISEASSMLFEFAALDKPAIWCDFLTLRWTYKGPLRFRLNRCMDSRITRYHDMAVHAASYSDLTRLIGEQLQEPHRFRDKRRQYCTELMGSLDGGVSKRIADYLLESQD